MSKIHSVSKEQHRRDCAAMREYRTRRWDTPWFIQGDVVWKDKRGGNRGRGTRWFVARCNDTDCPAQKLVSVSELEVAIL